jgi:hypothetical protein
MTLAKVRRFQERKVWVEYWSAYSRGLAYLTSSGTSLKRLTVISRRREIESDIAVQCIGPVHLESMTKARAELSPMTTKRENLFGLKIRRYPMCSWYANKSKLVYTQPHSGRSDGEAHNFNANRIGFEPDQLLLLL